jgi:probable HAF family extracellular repeat protein
MGTNRWKVIFWLLFIVITVLVIPQTAISRQYSIIDLGTLWGEYTYAYGINNAGQVVGFSTNEISSPAHAFLWENGTMIDLGNLGGYYSGAYKINNHGQVTGISTDSSGENHVFLWENGTMIDLGVSLGSGGQDINDYGQVVDGANRFWHSDGTWVGIGGYQALAINNHTQVAGSYDGGGGISHAYLWENGIMQDLGTLGGNFSLAKGINNIGQVVGYSRNSLGQHHAFLWENGNITDLGRLGQDYLSVATSINDRGQVVGFSQTSLVGPRRPFLWERGIMTDLNDLIDNNSGWILQDAWDINEKGQIVGRYFINGKMRSFLMTPVSESVTIDIKPGSEANSINPKSKGKIPVAILSTEDFDAPSQMDQNPLTLRFGSTGNEPSLAFCNPKGEDINGDGLEDLVCHFYTQETGFGDQCGDTEGILRGMTMDGISIEGRDSVRINPCKK